MSGREAVNLSARDVWSLGNTKGMVQREFAQSEKFLWKTGGKPEEKNEQPSYLISAPSITPDPNKCGHGNVRCCEAEGTS